MHLQARSAGMRRSTVRATIAPARGMSEYPSLCLSPAPLQLSGDLENGDRSYDEHMGNPRIRNDGGNFMSNKIRVIICDDSSIIRIGMSHMLGNLTDIEVVGQASDGAEGLELARKLKPDIVVMDIAMPVMNGIEATKLIKQEMPGIRVVVLSAAEDSTTIFSALAAGADGYCSKNIGGNNLGLAITCVRGGASWLDAAIAAKVLRSLPGEAVRGGSESLHRQPCRLSPRELQVLQLLANGLNNPEVSERLNVGLETVRTHVRHIMEKLGVHHRTQAVVKAIKEGLLGDNYEIESDNVIQFVSSERFQFDGSTTEAG
jgi:DNA-binding NarL/FixJ family response regulator